MVAFLSGTNKWASMLAAIYWLFLVMRFNLSSALVERGDRSVLLPVSRVWLHKARVSIENIVASQLPKTAFCRTKSLPACFTSRTSLLWRFRLTH